MFVIRKQLKADEGAPPNTRYNPDTDTFETSVDGGVTWTENPGADPRVNPAYQMPPNTEPDVRCAAAAGMVEDVRRVIDAAITGGGVVGIGNILIAFLILPLGWAFALIAVVAAALAGVSSAAWSTAFTEGVYDALLCMFYDALDADGRIDQAGWDALLAQAYIDFADPNVGGGLELVFKLHGVVGLNNAGSAYADPAADCTTCAPWAELMDFTISDYGFEPTLFGATPLAVYTPGVGFESIYTPTGGNGYTISSIARAFTADVTHIELTFAYTQGSCAPSGDAALYIYSQGFVNEFYRLNVCAVPTSPAVWDYEPTPGVPITVTQLQIAATAGVTLDDSDPGGSAVLISLRVCGVGTPPGVGVPDDPC